MKEISHNDELVDLVDSSGTIKKHSIPRSKVDQYPDLHLQIVIAVIFNEGKVLVHQRGLTKSVNRGDVDHVCGGILSGETPEEAAIRESREETGVTPRDLLVVVKGLNSYNRFRYLFTGKSEDGPVLNPKEAEWVKYLDPSELRARQESGEMTFVDEFFEDLELAGQKKI